MLCMPSPLFEFSGKDWDICELSREKLTLRAQVIDPELRGRAFGQQLSQNFTVASLTGVIILTISGGYHSQEMGLFSFNPPLRG